MTFLKNIPPFLFGLLAAGLFAFFLDRGLGWAGFPAESAASHAHPPRFYEKRQNLEYTYSFRTNREGIRYPDLPLEKPEGELRVAVLGDSFVEGTGIEEGERFTDLLEGRFSSGERKVRFINLGLAGTGPQQYERILEKTGWGYDPDAVILCLSANDLSNIRVHGPVSQKSSSGPLGKIYPRLTVLARQAFERVQKKFGKPETFEEKVMRKAAASGIPAERTEAWRQGIPRKWMEAANRGEIEGSLLSYGLFYPEYWTESLDIHTPGAERKWSTMESVLHRIVSAARAKGAAVYAVFIPCAAQYDPGFYENPPLSPVFFSGVRIRKEWLNETSKLESRIEAWAAGQKVPFLNLTPLIRQAVIRSPGLNYPVDGHWNARGHAFASAEIGQWLERETFAFLAEG